jgi:hypothetical protein
MLQVSFFCLEILRIVYEKKIYIKCSMVFNKLKLLSSKKVAPLWELNKIAVIHRNALVSKRCITRVLNDTQKIFTRKTDFLRSGQLTSKEYVSREKFFRHFFTQELCFFFYSIFLEGLECAGHSFAYVPHFVFFGRCLDSNPESCRGIAGVLPT